MNKKGYKQMKRIILILALLFATLAIKAQEVSYDTVFPYHPPLVDSCICGSYTALRLYNAKAVWCLGYPDTWLYNYDYSGHATTPNEYGVRGVAQPYHFDSTVYVCGVYAQISTSTPPITVADGFNFRLLDLNFRELDVTPIYYVINGFCTYYFNYIFPIQDFYLAGDLSPFVSAKSVSYWITGGITDSCLENVLDTSTYYISHYDPEAYCKFEYSPAFKKDDKWILFEDDTIYSLFRKNFIKIYPILMILSDTNTTPSDSGSIVSVEELEKFCAINPNPAQDYLNVSGSYKIRYVEIFNSLGIKVKIIPVNNVEATLDIKNLPSGNYIIKLHTTQGIATKKFVIR
jgi:hypothetical protein